MIPLATILSASITAEQFNPPQDFQLESFWHDWIVLKRQQRPSISVTAYVRESALPFVGEYIENSDEINPKEGKIWVMLRFETFEHARTWILGFGNAIEVIEPLSLRLSIEDYARQTLSIYENE